MLFKIAWRNVFRNRKRSLLTVVSIFFGALVVALAEGWINGMVETYARNYIDFQTGHVRITTAGFAERERFLPVDEIISTAGALQDTIARWPRVDHVSERLRFGILLGRGESTVEAMGMGLDLADNPYHFEKHLTAGSVQPHGLIMGRGLAEKLGVAVGEDLLLATKTSEGGLNGIKLKVAGIVKLGIGPLDRKVFFISLADAKRLLKISAGTTELYVYLKKTEDTPAVHAAIEAMLPPGLVAQTYLQQMGPMYSTLQASKSIYAFLGLLIMFLASFVVINTMMMAIFERLREIGTLKALGMTERELFWNFALEGAILGTIGGIAGSVAGYGLVVLMAIKGVNLESALQSYDMAIAYVIHPSLHASYFLFALGLAVVIPALSAMIPARMVRKLTAAEALRK